MIPRISHSRSQLYAHLNEYDNGAMSFFVSSDTYPDLFTFAFPDIVKKAPKGWSQKKMAYLWFPPDALDQGDLDSIQGWKDRFESYVLLGLNEHIEGHFTDELDFCMALDFNFDPGAEKRTVFGEAEYQLKYKSSSPHLKVLGYALIDAIADLPIPPEFRDSFCISCIPAPAEQRTVPRRLATGIAKKMSVDFIDAELQCPKEPLKGVAVEEKIPIWQDLYDNGCVSLNGDVSDRLVVIIDDLYQSGATMWAYAGFLKTQGAKHVFGLPCVKSLRDSDNR